MQDHSGKQTIGCEVTSCRFNERGAECSLSKIQVKPRCDCHTGNCDESECGSYVAK